jgi:hypothetical protein
MHVGGKSICVAVPSLKWHKQLTAIEKDIERLTKQLMKPILSEKFHILSL